MDARVTPNLSFGNLSLFARLRYFKSSLVEVNHHQEAWKSNGWHACTLSKKLHILGKSLKFHVSLYSWQDRTITRGAFQMHGKMIL